MKMKLIDNNKNLDSFKSNLDADIKKSIYNKQNDTSTPSRNSYLDKFNEIMRNKNYQSKNQSSNNYQYPILKK